jgi:Flp pilus assembly protein TadG
MSSSRRRKQSGATIIEFSLSLAFLVPLLIGTFVFGFRLVQAQQVDQITRDLAHMYSRGIEFDTSAASEAVSLAGQFGLSSSGNAALIFSTITLASTADCQAFNSTNTCPNLGKPVFVEQIGIGNVTANASVFGTPVSAGTLPATSPAISGVPDDYSTTVSQSAQGGQSWALANGFSNIVTLTSGQVVYVVEMFDHTPALNVGGITGSPLVYSRAIF